MDPLEFRMLNMYRDGDMKAHRRQAKNTALIECAQVTAEKANWPLRDEFRRMSSRTGGSLERGGVVDRTRAPALASAPKLAPADAGAGRTRVPSVAPPPVVPQRIAYERPMAAEPARAAPPQQPASRSVPTPSAAPPASSPAGSTHGAARFSSVFGTRRR
jgi:hypothetical protein